MKGCVCLSLLLLLGGLFTSVGAESPPETGVSTPASSEASATTAKEGTTAATSPGTTGNTTQPLPTNATGTTTPTPAATGTTPTPAATGMASTPADSTASGSSVSPNTTAQASTEPPTTAPSPPLQTTANTTDTTSALNTTLPVTTSTVNTTHAPTTAAATTPVTSSSAASSKGSSDTPAPTPPSTPSPTPSPTVPVSVVLSETNLLLASENLFVEMKGNPNGSLANLTLAVLNVSSATAVWKVDFNRTQTFSASGFFVEPINAGDVQSLTTVVIGLYHSKGCNSSCSNNNLMDFMALSTDRSPFIIPSLREALLPMSQSVTVVKRGLNPTQKMTLSRCETDSTSKNANAFVLTKESRDAVNTCEVKMANDTEWTLQLLKKKGSACAQIGSDSGAMEKRVENLLVGEINKQCQCGLTSQLVQVTGNLSCTTQNVFLKFKVKESYEGQTEKVITSFMALVQNKTVFTVNNEEYSAVNCTRECQPSPGHHPPGKPSKANSSVTIAVVLSSVAVFLIILIAVILYMRGKRRGIIRQFRMTRLEEDDDMDDMDDFIGGGEASFSTRQR